MTDNNDALTPDAQQTPLAPYFARHPGEYVHRGPRPWNRRVLKIDGLLTAADRPAYQALLDDPRTTYARLHAWLRDRGYDVGWYAVKNHRRAHRREVRQIERVARAAANYAQAAAAAADDDSEGISQTALTLLEHMVVDRLVATVSAASKAGEAGGDAADRPAPPEAKQLGELAKVLQTSAETRQKLLAVQKAVEDAGARNPGRRDSSREETVNRMRYIMGLTVQWKAGHPPDGWDRWRRQMEKKDG
jgi:hypothetical protein